MDGLIYLALRVGQRIAPARRATGLTQAELAERLACPTTTLIHYEHGRHGITVERLSAIATALDLPPASLLIDDPSTAQLVAQMLARPNLPPQLAFFLTTLESDGEAETNVRELR
jgi:transcriptional regulator with XRE-family HTH domain